MYYFDTRSDLLFVNLFKDEVDCFNAANITKCEYLRSGYMDKENLEKLTESEELIKKLRETIAKKLIKAIKVSANYGVSTSILSIPPLSTGGAVLPVNIYESILNDNSYGRQINNQMIMDTINKTIGQIETQNRKDLVNIFNPFFWFRVLFVKIIRIPFSVLSISGFNIENIESHFISKIFKCLESAVLVLMLLKLGFERSEIKSVLVGLISK